jgi:hypothetical protein
LTTQPQCAIIIIENKKGKVLDMRKAILNENKQVIGFEPMKEEMSEQTKEHYKKQVEFVQKKYGLKVDK